LKNRAVDAVLMLGVLALYPLVLLATTAPYTGVAGIGSIAAIWLLPPRLWPGERRRRGVARIVGAAALAALALVPAFLYEYGIAIAAGLCGDGNRVVAAVGLCVPYVVVSTWGFVRRNWLLLAWPLAVLAAATGLMFVEYLDPSAHGHCETMTPYSRSVVAVSMYSPTSIATVSPPRLNVASTAVHPRGSPNVLHESRWTRAFQPGSSRR
jgi:hypothetical protein